MIKEMKTLHKNYTCELVELPSENKTVGVYNET